MVKIPLRVLESFEQVLHPAQPRVQRTELTLSIPSMALNGQTGRLTPAWLRQFLRAVGTASKSSKGPSCSTAYFKHLSGQQHGANAEYLATGFTINEDARSVRAMVRVQWLVGLANIACIALRKHQAPSRRQMCPSRP